MSTHEECVNNCGGTACDAPKVTITTAHDHGIEPGDRISYEVRDTRWWRRLLYWALRRGEPRRAIVRSVSQASKTTLTM